MAINVNMFETRIIPDAQPAFEKWPAAPQHHRRREREAGPTEIQARNGSGSLPEQLRTEGERNEGQR